MYGSVDHIVERCEGWRRIDYMFSREEYYAKYINLLYDQDIQGCRKRHKQENCWRYLMGRPARFNNGTNSAPKKPKEQNTIWLTKAIRLEGMEYMDWKEAAENREE